MNNEHLDGLCEATLIGRIERVFADAEHLSSRGVIEALAKTASSIDIAAGDQLIDENQALLRYSPVATACYRSYVLSAEDAEVQRLLGASGDQGAGASGLFSNFGKTTYDRVADMFERLSFCNCERLVVVGCGAFPATNLQIVERTNVQQVVGLDVRPQAIRRARQIQDTFGIDRLSFEACDGQSYNFSDASIVYITNMVEPKSAVLQRIAETAPEDVRIIVRDPYSLGRLFTQRGTDNLNDQLIVAGFGPPEEAFLSRNVYLQLQPVTRSRI